MEKLDIPESFTPASLAAFIRDHIILPRPELHEQNNWIDITGGEKAPGEMRSGLAEGSCGSTGCVAGWAAVLTVPEGTVFESESESGFDTTPLYVRLPGASWVRTIDNVGRDALGLSYAAASYLFDGGLPRSEVVEGLSLIAIGRTDLLDQIADSASDW